MAPTVAPSAPPETDVDPGSLSAIQWSTRAANLASRGVTPDDPRVRQCSAALAFHRVRRAIESEVGALSPDHVDLLTAAMRRAAGVQR